MPSSSHDQSGGGLDLRGTNGPVALYAEPLRVEPEKQSDFERLLGQLGMLVRRKWLVLLPALCCAAAAFVISFLETPLYQASGSLEIQGPPESFLDIRTSLVQNPYVQNQAKLVRSQPLLERARERVLAELAPVAEPAPPEKNAFVAWLQSIRREPSVEDAIARAADSVDVLVSNDHTILELSCASSDPQVAAAFVNTLSAEYIAWNQEQRWETYRQTGDWLLRSQGELREKLEEAEEALQSYAKRNGIVLTSEDLTSDDSNVTTLRLKQLQAELSAAQSDRILKEAALSVVTSADPDHLPAVAEASPLRQYQTELSKLERQLAELNTTLTPEHYRVRQLQAQIDQMRRTLANETLGVIERVRGEYEAAVRRERMLTKEYAKQSMVVSDQSERLIQYNILKREVDINRKLYEATLRKVEEASLTSALQAANARVVNLAHPPDEPFKPNQLLYAGLGMLAGLGLGVGLVFWKEYSDRSIRAPGEATLIVDAPELGAIPSARLDPHFRSSKGGRALARSKRSPSAALSLREQDGQEGEEEPPIELVTFSRRPSVVADSIRATLASIRFGRGRNAEPPKVIVVTSPNPRDGKSLTTSNLAVALSEMNRRVLVIDGDLRRSRQDRIFGKPNVWGLSSLLLEKKPIADYPAELGLATHVPGVYLLPSGPVKTRVGPLIQSDRLRQLIERVRNEYDLVLIDTPPLLPLSDARVFGQLSEGVVLVVRAGHTTREAAKASAQRLIHDNAPLLGVILNDWDPQRTSYGYYGSSYYGDYYAEAENGDRPEPEPSVNANGASGKIKKGSKTRTATAGGNDH